MRRVTGTALTALLVSSIVFAGPASARTPQPGPRTAELVALMRKQRAEHPASFARLQYPQGYFQKPDPQDPGPDLTRYHVFYRGFRGPAYTVPGLVDFLFGWSPQGLRSWRLTTRIVTNARGGLHAERAVHEAEEAIAREIAAGIRKDGLAAYVQAQSQLNFAGRSMEERSHSTGLCLSPKYEVAFGYADGMTVRGPLDPVPPDDIPRVVLEMQGDPDWIVPNVASDPISLEFVALSHVRARWVRSISLGLGARWYRIEVTGRWPSGMPRALVVERLAPGTPDGLYYAPIVAARLATLPSFPAAGSTPPPSAEDPGIAPLVRLLRQRLSIGEREHGNAPFLE